MRRGGAWLLRSRRPRPRRRPPRRSLPSPPPVPESRPRAPRRPRGARAGPAPAVAASQPVDAVPRRARDKQRVGTVAGTGHDDRGAEGVLAALVFGQHPLVRIYDQHAVAAVDDDQFVFAHQFARSVQRNDGGDVQTARHHRRVRGRAAHIGDETGEVVALELHHVGGRQIVRHQDQRLLGTAGGRRYITGLAGKRL